MRLVEALCRGSPLTVRFIVVLPQRELARVVCPEIDRGRTTVLPHLAWNPRSQVAPEPRRSPAPRESRCDDVRSQSVVLGHRWSPGPENRRLWLAGSRTR